MLTLYYGSGSTGFSVGGIAMEETEWRKLRGAASRLLAVRGFKESAELLTRYPFQIHAGDNDFGDDFSVLYAEVDLPIYVEIEEIHRGAGGRRLFAAMANTFMELGRYTRFVAVDLSIDDASLDQSASEITLERFQIIQPLFRAGQFVKHQRGGPERA